MLLVGVELVRHLSPGQFLIQHDALAERHQFVLYAVRQAQGRQVL
jgi:hypothetical protein